MKRKVLLLMTLGVLFLQGCTSYGVRSLMEANWKIVLPEDFTMIYEATTEASFHGDGIRYRVLKFSDSTELKNFLPWSNKLMTTIFSETPEEAANRFLDEIQVPIEERGDFGHLQYWYDNKTDASELLIFLDVANDCLYIIESFL